MSGKVDWKIPDGFGCYPIRSKINKNLQYICLKFSFQQKETKNINF